MFKMFIPNITTGFHARMYGRFIEIRGNLRGKKLHRANQDSNFLGSRFGDEAKIRAPTKFRTGGQNEHLDF